MYKRPYIPVRVYVWTSSTKKSLYIFDTSDSSYEEEHIRIKENIYQDDTVKNALTKIGLYINNNLDTDVYGWIKHKSLMFDIKNKIWKGYNVNPFLSTDIQSQLLQEPVDYDYKMDELFNYSSVNIAFSTNLPNSIHPYYFVKVQKMTTKQYLQREDLLKKLINEPDNTDLLPEYYTRIQYHSKLNKIILSDLFDYSHTSKYIDMIQWVDDSSKILYKLHKKNKIKKEYLNSWTNVDKIDKIKVVNMYSIYNKNSYCKITIDESNLHITYILNGRQYIKYKDVQKHKKVIEKIIKNILKQSITLKELVINAGIKINIQSSSSKLLMNKLSKQIDIFNVIKNNDNDKKSIICTYIRSSNYKKNTDIYDYIKSRINLGITKSEIANELVNLGIVGDINKMINDEVEMIDKGNEVLTKTVIKENGTIVEIAPRYQGYNISIINCPNLTEMRYMFFWLSKIISTTIDKKIKEVAPPPQPKILQSDSESSKSSNSNISQASSVSSYNSSAGAPNKKNSNYLITMLQQTDKELFGEYYARTKCQSHVQPVVFSKEQKDILEKNNQMHFDNYVEYGSSVDNLNYYACPKLWCPQSKIPLLPGQICPIEDEEPIKMYKDIDKDKKSYVRLIKPNDKGMCVPCCGKNIQSNDKINVCMKYLGADDNTNEKVAVNINDENYLMNKVPIDMGRYGTIPEFLHSLLSNEPYKNCTGALNTKTYCYVKQGIDNNKHESILYSLMELLNIKSKKELKKVITSKLDLITFLTLENGNICKEFLSIREVIPENNPKLVKDFTRFNKNKVLSNISSNSKNLSHILNIYVSYQKYIDYILTDDITVDKKPEYILPLIYNLYNTNLIMWEKNGTEVYLNCHNTIFEKNSLDAKFCMIIKEGSYYEPIIMKKRSSEVIKIFNLSDHLKIQTLIKKCEEKDSYFNTYNNLFILHQWSKKVLDNPNVLTISKVVINDDLTINKVLTNKNILLKFDKIGLSYLKKILNDFNISNENIVFFKELIGNNYNVTVNKNDISKFISKTDGMGIKVNIGEVIADKENQIYSKLTIDNDDLISNEMIIHTNTVNDFYKQNEMTDKQTKRWYELQKLIAKKIIKNNLNHKEIKEQLKHIPEQEIIKIILEEIPSEKEDVKKWLSTITIQTKYDYLSDNIKESKKEFIFSQNALVKNGEKYLPKYLQTYHPSLPNEINNEEDNIEDYNIDNKVDEDVQLPSIFTGPLKKLSVKWNKNKKNKWSEMVYIDSNYKNETLKNFINWLISKMKIPSIDYDTIYNSSYNKFIDIRNDMDAMNIILHDTSYYNEWSKKSKKTYSTINVFLEKYYSKLTDEERIKYITEIFNSRELYPNDLVLKSISSILNISILIIQRGTYGDFDNENTRGDINDMVSSSLLYSASNIYNRPLIIFNKKCDKTKCSYFLVVDKISPNSLYLNYEYVHKDIKELVEKHLQIHK